MGALFLSFAAVLAGGQDHDPINEITLTRTECFGPCPAFTATLRADGSMTYHGEANVTHLGDFTANIGKHEFNALSEAIDEVQFQKLKVSYDSNFTDMSATEITVIRKSSKKKVSVAHEQPTVWLIARAMDAIIAEATDWKRVSPKKRS